MDVKKYLDFCNNVLVKSGYSVEQAKENNVLIKKIEERAADPFLRVAVIGDFSAGKSTFINALLNQKLLKTAWLATTAIPTYIFPSKSRDEIIVRPKIGKKYNLCDPKDADRFAKKYSVKLPADMAGIIAAVTTSNVLSEAISEVVINVKTADKIEKICIIDTPGVNPGNPDAKRHVLETQKVLQEKADATIILFSSQQVYSHSFENFLEENASRFMEDAIYVVTMLDKKDPSERGEIINYVQNILKERFHIDNPKIYGCAANYITMDTLPEDGKYWVDAFYRMKSEVVEYLALNRERIINKELSVLLNELLVNTNKVIENSIEEIDNSLKVLEENSVDKLEIEINRILKNAKDAISKTKKEYVDNEKGYAQMVADVKSGMSRGIDSCKKIAGDDYDSIPKYCKDYLKYDVSSAQEKYQKKIVDSLNEIIEDYNNSLKEVYIRFNLALEGGQNQATSVDNKKIAIETPEISYYGGTCIAEDLGGLAGLIVGLAPALVFGIIDEILGTDITGGMDKAFSWIGKKFNQAVNSLTSEETLRNKKATVKRELSDKINTSFNENKKKILDEVAKGITAYEKNLTDIKDEYKKTYRSVYAEKSKAIIEKKKQLQESIKTKEIEKNILATYICEVGGTPSQARSVRPTRTEMSKVVNVLSAVSQKRSKN